MNMGLVMILLMITVTPVIIMVYIMSVSEAAGFLEGRGQTSLGVMLGLQGNAKGKILQILSKKFALRVINYFFQGGLEEIDELDEMSFSVLQEIGNITSGAYCNSLASMTGLFIDISTPTHCKNMRADIGLHELSPEDKIILISNKFFIDDEEVSNDFLFMPDEGTTEQVLEKLKEYYGYKS